MMLSNLTTLVNKNIPCAAHLPKNHRLIENRQEKATYLSYKNRYIIYFCQKKSICRIMIEPNTTEKRAVIKWQEAGKAGFQIVPDILFKKQIELKLGPTDIVVLMHISMHWWYEDQKPFPRLTTIARRMGVGTRTVQRSIKKLSQLGYVSKEKQIDKKGIEREVFNLGGLVEILSQYARVDPDYAIRLERHKLVS